MLEEFVKAAIEQDGRNRFSMYMEDMGDVPIELHAFYRKYNPEDVEVVSGANSVRFVSVQNQEQARREYQYLDADMILATVNGDPVFMQGSRIYICPHGVKQPKIEKIADSFEQFIGTFFYQNNMRKGINMTGTGMVVGGTVLLAIVAAVLVQMTKQKKDSENVIEECFGRPMVTNTFTFDEAREWIEKREGNLSSDVKALITTLSQKNLAKFGVEFPVKENAVIKNYLLLAIIDTKQGKILESALVKYEKLDQDLKEALDKGDGSMVVKA